MSHFAPLEDRFVGCLVGGALGDALGYPIEFTRAADEIAARFGVSAPFDLDYDGPALISDDTQMTLFSAEALVRARQAKAREITPFALGAYQRWYATQELSPRGRERRRSGQGLLLAEAGLFARRAPGNTCLSALALSFTRQALANVRDPPNGSKGCGAVMRSAPFGLAASTREEAWMLARDAGVLTHGHPSGFLSGAYLAALVYDLARGVALEEALPLADALLVQEPEHDELGAVLARARLLAAQGAPTAAAIEELGGGWVGEEALAIGVACALGANRENVAEILWRAVAHSGDSDSTGSIAGNLVGAQLGVQALPERWRARLELGALVERVARDLYAAAIEARELDTGDYPPFDGVVRALRG